MTAPGWWREELTPYGWTVVLRKLGLRPESSQGVILSVVRGLQLRMGLPVTGRVDRETAIALGEATEWQVPPAWWFEGLWVQDLALDADAVHRLQGRLGLRVSDLIDVDLAWHLVVEGLVT